MSQHGSCLALRISIRYIAVFQMIEWEQIFFIAGLKMRCWVASDPVEEAETVASQTFGDPIQELQEARNMLGLEVNVR